MMTAVGSSVDDIIQRMRDAPQNIRFAELHKVCVEYFGQPRRSNGSHVIFKTPWPGDPRVNIQDAKGNAKRYQVLQVLEAIAKMEDQRKGK